jgi:pimeloyl-ACP methyl ester carboxylesterase
VPSASPSLPYGPIGRSAWLDVDWRRHQRWVDVDGRPVNVIDLGEGDKTIVFVHGLAGSWVNWLENIPAFSDRHRVVAMDLPGFGSSPMPADRISIPGYGRFVDALLDRLEVDAAAVVGNSMGGFIGAELAIQFPQRVERLVLLSAAGLTIEYQRDERILAALRRLERTLTVYGGWLATRSGPLVRRPRSRRALMKVVAEHADLLPAALVAEQVKGSGTPGFIDALDALTDYPIRARLPEIACPTLIVWGEEDRLVPVRDADEFERLIPDSRKVVFPDTGHVAMFERPRAFNELLAAFLEEGPGEEVQEAPAQAAARAEQAEMEAAAEAADRAEAEGAGASPGG